MQGRSICLDIKATDATGRIFNVEVQRKDNGANPRRARYHSSLIDANLILPGQNVETLPETYVIFITEHDVLKETKPLYHINRMVEETGKHFYDGAHIIYVNGEYRGQDLIGDLMHDFNCPKPSEMKLKTLAARAKYFKETEKGVANMCDAVKDLVDEFVEEAREECRKENQIEIAKKLLQINMPVAQITDITGLSAEQVNGLLKA
ncbi:MAG: PD-(D/E)XK nuclease family transposase [Treponema sp.]|nr:PD-(D/E)XK nuclease family transposase [Spirochaetales bacterium]MDY5812327.1 PD-(D/E)XK nuclease family transposase [Treponema sp.]